MNCAGFNESGSLLASGSDDLDIRVWDWAQGRCLRRFASGHTMNVFQVPLHIHFWLFREGALGVVEAKFVGNSGDCHIVSCARDGQVRIAQLAGSGELRETRRLAQHKDSAHKLALHADAPHQVLSCGEDGAVFEIDLRDPAPNK